MKPLLLTTLLFSLSNPFSVTATEPSLKFYRSNEIINTKSINIYIALVETITEGTTPDIFRFNDIHVKKINESTWEIANNTISYTGN